METEYLTTSEEDLKRAAEIIKAGGLAGFPTETVYGLGGNALDPQASKKIYAAKGRPSDNPLIVHISDMSQLEGLVTEIPENAKKLAAAIWPGPMTMVLKKKDIVPKETTGGLDTVAVRMPASDTALKLISLSGCPIAAPSANLSGHPSPTRWQHVRDDLDGRADAIIMGEPCIGGIESTVIDMTEDHPQILRPGLITPERVTEILGVPCDYDPAILGRPDPALVPKAPGMKYRHYAPKAQMILFSGERRAVISEIERQAAKAREEGRLAETLIYEDSHQAAERLFDDLRKTDSEGADVIYAMALSEEESVAFSVMNRMLKSAGYNIISVGSNAGEEKMKIALASDHGGFELKEAIKKHLIEDRKIEVLDLGTHSAESVDYPAYGHACGKAVASGEADAGIVCCGTGIGISISANKVRGIRCALVTNDFAAEMCRRHNNANMIAFGGRTSSAEDAIRWTDIWLDTPFDGGRHERRVGMIEDVE